MPTPAYRMLQEAILSANVLVVPYGTTDGSNTVSATVKPAAPTAQAPGKWISLGQVTTSTITPERKDGTVEGADANGIYRTRKMPLITSWTLAFTTPDVSPEAIQLAYGLEGAINDDATTNPRPFVTNGTMKVWLMIKVADAYRNGLDLHHAVITGELSLVNPITHASDPAAVEWQLMIEPNALDEFKSINVQHPAS